MRHAIAATGFAVLTFAGAISPSPSPAEMPPPNHDVMRQILSDLAPSTAADLAAPVNTWLDAGGQVAELDHGPSPSSLMDGGDYVAPAP